MKKLIKNTFPKSLKEKNNVQKIPLNLVRIFGICSSKSLFHFNIHKNNLSIYILKKLITFFQRTE